MENSLELYCMNIIVNICSFSPLNTNVNTNLKYYGRQTLNKKLKLMGESITFLWKSYCVMNHGLRNIFWKICKTLYTVNVHFFTYQLHISKISTPNIVFKGWLYFSFFNFFNNYFLTGLCNISFKCWFVITPLLTPLPEDILSKIFKLSK